MIRVANSVLTGRNIPNLTCANQRYSIPSQTDQKTQITGLKNLSFIARLFIYIKEKFTRKHARPFSQILYKFDPQALDLMKPEKEKNTLISLKVGNQVYKLSNASEYLLYFAQKFPETFASQFNHLNKKPSLN
jgi:hypothetical protein